MNSMTTSLRMLTCLSRLSCSSKGGPPPQTELIDADPAGAGPPGRARVRAWPTDCNGSWMRRTSPGRTPARSPSCGPGASAATGCGSCSRRSRGSGAARPRSTSRSRTSTEARAYLAHPVLGPRLRECAAALVGLDATDPVAVLGEHRRDQAALVDDAVRPRRPRRAAVRQRPRPLLRAARRTRHAEPAVSRELITGPWSTRVNSGLPALSGRNDHGTVIISWGPWRDTLGASTRWQRSAGRNGSPGGRRPSWPSTGRTGSSGAIIRPTTSAPPCTRPRSSPRRCWGWPATRGWTRWWTSGPAAASCSPTCTTSTPTCTCSESSWPPVRRRCPARSAGRTRCRPT